MSKSFFCIILIKPSRVSSRDAEKIPHKPVLFSLLFFLNVDGTNSVDISIRWYDASASATWHLCKTVTLPADSTLVVLGKDSPIYLEEGDRIRGLASAASDAQVTVSYEELDDA